MTVPTELPGHLELSAARTFFLALADRDATRLTAMLDERPSFHNIDGPVEVDCAERLARKLAARDRSIGYELIEIAAQPGRADARFVLRVEGVPGAIVLEAVLGFAGERIASIHVHQP